MAAGHVVDRNGSAVELEAGTAAADLAPALEALGHTVKVGDLTSGLHLILFTADGLVAGVDPRREGRAVVGK